MKQCCHKCELVADEGECDAGRRVGSNMDFHEGKTCYEALAEYETEDKDEDNDEEQHACVSYGFGAMMKQCCHKCELVADEGECDAGRRVGGNMDFHEGKTCYEALAEYETEDKDEDNDEEQHACVSYGFGAMMKQCCHTCELVADEGECDAGMRLGGNMKFHEGKTCYEALAEYET